MPRTPSASSHQNTSSRVRAKQRSKAAPFGVLFGVEPWNFPYYQLARFAAPNLMAGNVVMVKHAGCVPQCAIAFEKLWLEAGAPAGAYTNLLISHDQVNRVIDDPRIKGVALTGSVEAGKIVAGRAGQNLKKSTMELGGSDAFIVLEDADLEKTVKWAVWGKMNNTGQCCVAAKRFIVVEELADRFLEQVPDSAGGTQARRPDGRGDDARTPVHGSGPGATAGPGQASRRQGCHPGDGRQTDRSAGRFHAADDPDGYQARNPAFREEFFGPVALFFRVKNEDEAVALANDSEFGLGGLGLHQGCRARQTRGEPRRHGHDVRQSPDLDDTGPAVRRHQELRLRTRALQHGHPGVREQEAGPRSLDRRSRVAVGQMRCSFGTFIAAR